MYFNSFGVVLSFFSSNTKPYILPCNHNICLNCVDTLISEKNTKCPICNFKFSEKEAKKVYDDYIKAATAEGLTWAEANDQFKQYANEMDNQFMKQMAETQSMKDYLESGYLEMANANDIDTTDWDIHEKTDELIQQLQNAGYGIEDISFLTPEQWKQYYLGNLSWEEIVSEIEEGQRQSLEQTRNDFLNNDIKQFNSDLNSIIGKATKGTLTADDEDYQKLSRVADGFVSIIYPFQWIHTYIPIMSDQMLKYLETFLPFLNGINVSLRHLVQKVFKEGEIDEDDEVFLVNIGENTNTIKLSSTMRGKNKKFEKYIQDNIPALPSALEKELKSKLKKAKYEVDDITNEYLKNRAERVGKTFKADDDAVYEETIEINLCDIKPTVSCPHLPENTKSIDEIKKDKIKIDQVVIGSCTNGRFEDMLAAYEVLKGHKVKEYVRCIIIPATMNVYKECIEKGIITEFINAGAIVSTPTCGPCLGGYMGILAKGERCISTTNRNFVGRMGHTESEVYLASPRTAAKAAIAGYITD